jgi:hypothetical protein
MLDVFVEDVGGQVPLHRDEPGTRVALEGDEKQSLNPIRLRVC